MSTVAAARSDPLTITPHTQEVRLAMAWNGGVSLAIWMGGVAVELDAARRAHLGVEEGAGSQRIYNALCRAFNRMLVVDILTGASAGGINGALLGAVITHRRRLEPAFLRDRWIGLGDFSKMLRPTNAKAPPSLMDGDYFRDQVLATFRDCLGPGNELQLADGEELPDEVFLDVQATNVDGVGRAIADEWEDWFYAREYRAPMKFRERGDFTAKGLATAARASASFPGAFQPAEISGEAAARAGFPGKTRWGIDGGLLENAPIEAAIELIPRRRARRDVRRFVCYVNADPPRHETIADIPDRPDLQSVLAHVVNLPRNARTIDELIAIEDAFRRGDAARHALLPLAQVPRLALTATANGMLESYRRQRILGSLEEITTPPGLAPRPGLAREIFKRLEDAGELRLPWVPSPGTIDVSLTEWQWGIRAAERVLVLFLDLIRLAAAEADDGSSLLRERRDEVDDAIARLERLSARFRASEFIRAGTIELRDVPAEQLAGHLQVLDEAFARYRDEIQTHLQGGTDAFLDAIADLPLGEGLLEGLEDRVDQRLVVLWRAVAIEVVRRAFVADHEFDSAQELHFVQLTPVAPCPVMTPTPFTDRGPDTPELKLTGIDLGHFAAFYRGSWRANDFMWGRLDGADRIVDLLVDDGTPSADAATILADVLVPGDDGDGAADRRELVREALRDSGIPDPPPDADDLHGLVVAKLQEDGGKRRFTRILCARAAQYEALREELPVFVDQMKEDSKLGCFTDPIELTSGSTLDQIKQLRLGPENTIPVPERLGRGISDEATSTLALRTLSHTALVALAALRSLRLPLAGAFAPLRIPFLSISGLTSKARGKRAAAGAAYAASAAYITARLLGAEEQAVTPLDSITSLSTIVYWIAALAVVGLVLVPLWRAARASDGIRTLGQGLWALVLLALGGGVVVVYGIVELGGWETLTASTGPTPPGWILLLALASLGPAAFLLRRLPSLGPVRALGKKLDSLDTGGALTALVVAAASVVLFVWSGWTLLDDARSDQGGWWEWIGLGLVILAAGAGLLYALTHRLRGNVPLVAS